MAHARRLNVLFFFTDQQRWDTCGCYGNPLGLTPTLDALAARGVRFEHAFTPQPVCGPARGALQTSRFASQIHCWKNGIPLQPDARTVARIAGDAGYQTAMAGKWHLASEVNDATPESGRGGYEWWLASNLLEVTSHPYGGRMWDGAGQPRDFTAYRADAVTDAGLQFLRERDRARPFYLMVSHLEPHQQNDMNRFVAPHGYAERYREFTPPGDLVGREGDWGEALPDYYGICRNLDENLARMLDELTAQGELENTVVIFSSDHGCHFRTRNDEYKRSCHEASIRVPLVIAGPGFEGGHVAGELVSLLDVSATISAVTSGTVAGDMEGRDLTVLARGDEAAAAQWPDEIFVQISEAQVARALRTARWKYCIAAPDMDPLAHAYSDVYREAELYDLDRDPHERNNLVRDGVYEAVRLNLRARMLAWLKRIEHHQPTILGPDVP